MSIVNISRSSLSVMMIIVVSLLIIVFCLLPGSGVSAQSASSKTIYTTVKENQAKFVTVADKVYFTWYLKSGIVNMTLGNPDLVDPATVNSMYNSIGTIKVTDVVEVNDTFTNLYLEFSNSAAADSVLSSININSWNAVKKSGIVLATDKPPKIPTAPPKTVLFGGIIAASAIFSAAISAFIVRKLALAKQEKAHKTKKEMANLEAQLVKDQIKKMGGSEKLLSSRNNRKFGGDAENDGGNQGGPYDFGDEMQEAPSGSSELGGYGAPPKVIRSGSNRSYNNNDATRSERSVVSKKSNQKKNIKKDNLSSRRSSHRGGEYFDEEEEDYDEEEHQSRRSSRAPPSEMNKSAKSQRSSRRR